jgi:hypothetical protein
MDREDYFLWKDFRESTSQRLVQKEFELVWELHAKYFRKTYYRPCTCKPEPTVSWIKDLNILFNDSKKYRVRK